MRPSVLPGRVCCPTGWWFERLGVGREGIGSAGSERSPGIYSDVTYMRYIRASALYVLKNPALFVVVLFPSYRGYYVRRRLYLFLLQNSSHVFFDKIVAVKL